MSSKSSCSNSKIFNDCFIYLSKANLSKTRYKLFESKIVNNGGKLIDDPKNHNITHVVVEETLSSNLKNCLNVLQNSGFDITSQFEFEIVRVDWLCDCLKEKQKIDTKSFQIKLQINQEISAGNVSSNSDSEEIKDEDLQPPESKKNKKEDEKRLDNTKYACCVASSSVTKLEKNQLIINELQKLADAFRTQGDRWRSYSYDKAVSALKSCDKDITSYEDARKLNGVGEKMALKIKEVIEEGQIRKVAEVCGDEKNKILDIFYGVWGAGPSTVQGWYQQGFRTLEDLETKATLTKQQKIGLKYYNEIQDKMPRKEVEEICEIIKQNALEIDSSLKLIICGSYRRGKEMCGDVDIVIIRPDYITSHEIVFPLHYKLKSRGFITDDLTALRPNGNEKKFLGMCKLPGDNQKHRRLDIFVVPELESATGIMHYTGSALFNRSIRLLASQKDMCLSEHALSSGVMKVGNEVMRAGVILPTPTEESIFQHLGLEYRLPTERDH